MNLPIMVRPLVALHEGFRESDCNTHSLDLGRMDKSAADTFVAVGSGVSDGIRTRDIQIHSLALYQLSYAHRLEGKPPTVHTFVTSVSKKSQRNQNRRSLT